MERVKIRFNNLQSHENTEFILKPGLNFILADDNNVGKSAIFKVLMTIAKAPNVSPRKLDRLIRVGCSKASASFRYRDELVVAWFIRENGVAARLFFEHTDGLGDTTRGITCPTSLLDALGIVVDANGELVNFNDADSVQLISQSSNVADNIITSVMHDPRVDRMKDNSAQLLRDIQNDLKLIDVKIEGAEATLKNVTYNTAIDEFMEMKEVIYAACRVSDDAVHLESYKADVDIGLFETMGRVLESCSMFQELKPEGLTSLDKSTKSVYRILQDLSVVNFESLCSDTSSVINLDKAKQVRNVLFKLQDASKSCVNLLSLGKKLKSLLLEENEVISTLSRSSSVKGVTCPVKGKVLYAGETCIPISE